MPSHNESEVARAAAEAARKAAQRLADELAVTQEQIRLAKLQIDEMRRNEGK